MEFQIKKIDTVGGVSSKDENTSIQWLNITIGIVGCPYDDIIARKTIQYEFSNDLTVTEAKNGIETFANTWVSTNYPTI